MHLCLNDTHGSGVVVPIYLTHNKHFTMQWKKKTHEKNKTKPTCLVGIMCNTVLGRINSKCPLPSSFISLSLLNSSCSTTVPLLAPYAFFRSTQTVPFLPTFYVLHHNNFIPLYLLQLFRWSWFLKITASILSLYFSGIFWYSGLKVHCPLGKVIKVKWHLIQF